VTYIRYQQPKEVSSWWLDGPVVEAIDCRVTGARFEPTQVNLSFCASCFWTGHIVTTYFERLVDRYDVETLLEGHRRYNVTSYGTRISSSKVTADDGTGDKQVAQNLQVLLHINIIHLSLALVRSNSCFRERWWSYLGVTPLLITRLI